MRRALKDGFTIVELLIVVVVIAILAVITIATYTGIQEKAKTSRSVSTADQVRTKSMAWNTLLSSYSNLAQLRTNSLDPVDMDTPGGGVGPEEALLSSPAIAIGATLDEVRADGGNTVYYEPCWDGVKLAGAKIVYWDYLVKGTVDIPVGACP